MIDHGFRRCSVTPSCLFHCLHSWLQKPSLLAPFSTSAQSHPLGKGPRWQHCPPILLVILGHTQAGGWPSPRAASAWPLFWDLPCNLGSCPLVLHTAPWLDLGVQWNFWGATQKKQKLTTLTLFISHRAMMLKHIGKYLTLRHSVRIKQAPLLRVFLGTRCHSPRWSQCPWRKVTQRLAVQCAYQCLSSCFEGGHFL